jgi:hypothetical protein
MHAYAVLTALKLIRSRNLSENGIKLGAYILGEYHLKLPTEGDDKDALEEVVMKLQYHFDRSLKPQTQAIIVTAVSKIAAAPGISADVREVAEDFLKKQNTNVDEEVQERSYEIIELINANPEIATSALTAMPAFAYRKSILLKDLKKKVKQSGVIDKGNRHLEGIKDVVEDDDEFLNQSSEQPQFAAAAPATSGETVQSNTSAVPQGMVRSNSDLLDLGLSVQPAIATTAPSSVDAPSSLDNNGRFCSIFSNNFWGTAFL